MKAPDKDTLNPIGENPTPPDPLREAYYRDRDVALEENRLGDKPLKILSRLALWILPMLILLGVIDVILKEALPTEKLLPFMQVEAALYTMKVKRYQAGPAPDLLFIGSSRVRDGIIPELFNRELSKHWGRSARAYNLGLVNAKTEEYHTLVTSYIPEPAPPYVVIGFSGTEMTRVHSFQYASRFLWRLPNLWSYLRRTSFRNFQVKHVEYFLEAQLGRLWYLFNHRDALSNLIQDRLSDFLGMKGVETLIRKEKQKEIVALVQAENGYKLPPAEFMSLESRLEKDPQSVRIPSRELVKELTLLNRSSAKMLRRIISRLQEKGSKVALVEIPPSPYLQERNPVLHGNVFRGWMARQAQEMGVIYLSFPPEETGLTNALYSDTNHLSLTGAVKYSQLLFAKLRNAGFFGEEPP